MDHKGDSARNNHGHVLRNNFSRSEYRGYGDVPKGSKCGKPRSQQSLRKVPTANLKRTGRVRKKEKLSGPVKGVMSRTPNSEPHEMQPTRCFPPHKSDKNLSFVQNVNNRMSVPNYIRKEPLPTVQEYDDNVIESPHAQTLKTMAGTAFNYVEYLPSNYMHEEVLSGRFQEIPEHVLGKRLCPSCAAAQIQNTARPGHVIDLTQEEEHNRAAHNMLIQQRSSILHHQGFQGHRVYVKNLPPTVSQSDLRILFGDIGPILSLKMIRPGVAEIVYRTLTEARNAITTYNNMNFDGHPMTCVLVIKRPSNVPRPSQHSSGEPMDTSTSHTMLMPQRSISSGMIKIKKPRSSQHNLCP